MALPDPACPPRFPFAQRAAHPRRLADHDRLADLAPHFRLDPGLAAVRGPEPGCHRRRRCLARTGELVARLMCANS